MRGRFFLWGGRVKGWIPVWRQLFRDDHWLAPTHKHPAGRREAWIDLVQLAQHSEYDHVETLQRGEFLASVRTLADRWKWSRTATQRYMDRLETGTMIGTVRGTPRGTVYRIVNYDTYAVGGDAERDTERDGMRNRSGTHAGHMRDKNNKEEGKNEENEGGIPAAVRGLYGWSGNEGTDPILLKAFPDDSAARDRCLGIAWQRFTAEGHAYQGKGHLFRAFVERVVREQAGQTGPQKPGGTIKRGKNGMFFVT